MVHNFSIATHGDLGILHFKKPMKELCELSWFIACYRQWGSLTYDSFLLVNIIKMYKLYIYISLIYKLFDLW